MGAPIGSKNALGNKGGGRKSAYQEKADAEELFKMFFEVLDKNDIKKILKGDKYTLKDVLVAKAFGGDVRALTAIFNRVFPANVNVGGQKGNPLIVLSDEELAEQIKQLQAELAEESSGGAEETEGSE